MVVEVEVVGRGGTDLSGKRRKVEELGRQGEVAQLV